MKLLRLANPIVHQQQPTDVSCVPTCIAMAVGIPVRELGVDLERSWAFHHFGVWLAERGIWMRECFRVGGRGQAMVNGTLYIAAVRSKNVIGGDHAVLVDTRSQPPCDNSRSQWKTYDPNAGREGREAFKWVDEYYSLDFAELAQRRSFETAPGESPAQ